MAQGKEYAEKSGYINQSQIKDFRYMSPKKWYRKYFENVEDEDANSKNFILGDLLDTYLTQPKLFEERFFVGNIKIPSDSIKWMMDALYKQLSWQKKY